MVFVLGVFMKLVNRFYNTKNRLSDTVKRFPVTTVFLVIITIINIGFVLMEDMNSNLDVCLIVGTLMAFLMELSVEYQLFKNRYLSMIIGGCSALLSYGVLEMVDKTYQIYIHTGIMGICISCVSLVFYVLYKNRENQYIFSHYIKTNFIVGIFAFVVYMGFLVSLLAFHFLIFNFNNIWKLVTILSILLLFLFQYVLFISYVPKKDEVVEVPNTYRVIIHKALFFLYLLLIGILYLYILKIILTLNMPIGKLNWFGSFALLFYVFFYLSVDESDGKIQTLFKKQGAFLLMPVLSIQLFAIVIRVNAYGLTTARFMSIVLVLVAVVFMVVSLLKLPIRYAFLGVPVIALLFTCTPLNIYDVPNRNQEHRLIKVLEEAGAIKDGKLDETVTLNDWQKEEVFAAYDYLKYSSGIKSNFFEEFKQSKFMNDGVVDASLTHEAEETTEEETIVDTTTSYSYYGSWMYDSGIDVKDYQNIKSVFGAETIYEGHDFKDFILGLEEDVFRAEEKMIVYPLSNTQDILFDHIDVEMDRDKQKIYYIFWSGYLAEK